MDRYNNRNGGSGEIKFEIEDHICTIAENESGWKKELNLVSWNGRPSMTLDIGARIIRRCPRASHSPLKSYGR